MKVFWICVGVTGSLVMFIAMLFDTSVTTEMGSVNNIGLIANKQNWLFIGGVATLLGSVMTMLVHIADGMVEADPYDVAEAAILNKTKKRAYELGIKRVAGGYSFADRLYADVADAVRAADALPMAKVAEENPQRAWEIQNGIKPE